jgi:5'-nucleotidase
MENKEQPQILLTNDDGIRSPGLWAAAEALSSLGFVTVAAPRGQCSGTGRSLPVSSDGVILESKIEIVGKTWKVYAIGGTPAQAVQHGIFELTPRKPDLVVAGINYGENVGMGVTVSGTVGAALEGAARGVPSLAVSLETEARYHLTYSDEINFSVAAHFTNLFARLMLNSSCFEDVDVLKVDVPSSATRTTPWKLTRLSRGKYFVPVPPKRVRLNEPGHIGYRMDMNEDSHDPDTDIYTLRVSRQISVTPLSLDLTSRVDLTELEQIFRHTLSQ